MDEQTTYLLNARVTSTGAVERVSGGRVGLRASPAVLIWQPRTLIDLRETANPPAWHPSPEDVELERLRGMARRGEIELGRGGMPEGFWDMPAPDDPEGLVRQALLEDRDSSL